MGLDSIAGAARPCNGSAQRWYPADLAAEHPIVRIPIQEGDILWERPAPGNETAVTGRPPLDIRGKRERGGPKEDRYTTVVTESSMKWVLAGVFPLAGSARAVGQR